MKIDLTKTPPENCPSFDVCVCNACPLHPDYHKTLFDLPEDKQVWGWRKCRATKPTRRRIGEAFKLKNRGMTDKEIVGIRKWESMTPEQQQAKREIMSKNSPFARLKSKGYAVVRVKREGSDITISNKEKNQENGSILDDSIKDEGSEGGSR